MMDYLSLLAALTHAGPERGHVLAWAIPEAEQRRLIARIRQASWRLTPEDRAILVARFRDGATFQQISGKSRERGRQLVTRALWRLRNHALGTGLRFQEMQDAVSLEPVPALEKPGEAEDPAWLSTRQAAKITDLDTGYLSQLARRKLVASRCHPRKPGRIQLNRESLHAYIAGRSAPRGRRRKGIWKE
jgi:hypothetical protein